MNETRRQPTFGRIRRIHMVGIGGIGMSSIAEVLLVRGFDVSGSDLHLTDVTERLQALGATIMEGHSAPNVEGADLVVYSSAIQPGTNPETAEAARLHIPLINRSVMLGELMRMKFGIGIAGTHGKTTTTSMAGLVVAEGGFDPTIIVGGKVSVFGSNAVAGEGDIILVEADEYDRTFLRLTPSIAVVTNIEEEHLDIYSDLDDLMEAFTRFAGSVPFFGAAICCLDDGNVQRMMSRLDRRIVTYGLSRQADVRAERVTHQGTTASYDLVHRGTRLGRIELAVPGMHNVRNSLAAVAVGLELDIPFEKIQTGLARFSGVQRRMHVIGESRGVLVVDDYAHHPTEVRATLETVATAWPERRVVAVFQPHLYSRTRDFLDAFARAFFDADVLVITEVYGAREQPIEGVNGRLVAERATEMGHRDVRFEADKARLPDLVAGLCREGDVVITMGAGDIWRVSRIVLDRLQAGEGA